MCIVSRFIIDTYTRAGTRNISDVTLPSCERPLSFPSVCIYYVYAYIHTPRTRRARIPVARAAALSMKNSRNLVTTVARENKTTIHLNFLIEKSQFHCVLTNRNCCLWKRRVFYLKSDTY